jgi:peptidoglycan/LPS O-acetylase OafA/YrhL
MNRNVYIQGLRGVLSSLVFIYHVILSGLPTFGGPFSVFNQFVLSFEFAVEIFFGVSGIVIFYAYRKAKTIPSFVIDRASRILPILWITVLIIYGLSRFDPRHALDVSGLQLLGNLFALPPLVPMPLIHPGAWSICYEFAFYCFFVIFGLLSGVINKRVALVITAVLGVIFVSTHLRTFPFLLGLLVAYAVEKRHAWLVNFKFAGVALFGAMLCLYFGKQLQGHYYISLLDTLADPLPALLFVTSCVLTFVGLAGTFFGQGLFCRILATPLMQWLGALSFSLYMWQGVTLAIVKRGMYMSGIVQFSGPFAQLAFFALAFPITLAISRVSQIYLEGAATRMLRDFAHRKLLPRAASSAV